MGSFPVHSGCVSYEPLTCQPPHTSLSPGLVWASLGDSGSGSDYSFDSTSVGLAPRHRAQ